MRVLIGAALAAGVLSGGPPAQAGRDGLDAPWFKAYMTRAAAPLPAGVVLRGAAAQMFDPGSAQFAGVRQVPHSGGGTALTGLVNGKDLYGGYTGFRAFCAIGYRMADGPAVSLYLENGAYGAAAVRATCER